MQGTGVQVSLTKSSLMPSCCLSDLIFLIIDSQNNSGWKAPQRVISSTFLLKAGSGMTSGCWGLYPVLKTCKDFNTTAQPLWATVSNAWRWKGFSSHLAETSLFSVYVHCLSSLSAGLGLVLLRAVTKKKPFYFSPVFLHALGRTITISFRL